MSEIGGMLREALLGDEPFAEKTDHAQLQESVRSFEKRMKTVRAMMWFAVTLMFGLGIWMLVLLLRAPEGTSISTLLIYATLFLWANVGVGFAKMWMFLLQEHKVTQKDLKRVQMMILDLTEARQG